MLAVCIVSIQTVSDELGELPEVLIQPTYSGSSI